MTKRKPYRAWTEDQGCNCCGRGKVYRADTAEATVASLRAEVERLKAERLEALNLAYALTPDCQTVGEAVSALLMIAATHRTRAELQTARAERAEQERDALKAEVAALKEKP